MLGKIHLYFGIIVVVIFLLTGQYMHLKYDHLRNMDSMNRALFRAGHLYILLLGLINVSLGAHFKISKKRIIKNFQLFGSVVIFIATLMVIFGFFTELPTLVMGRTITSYGLFLILGGVSIHGLSALVMQKQSA